YAVAQISVTVTPAPVSGATKGSVTLTCANTGLPGSMASVEYLLDGKPLSTLITSAPYQYTWNSAIVWDGFVTIQASARDFLGNEIARSNPLTLKISNKGATAQILSPATSPVSGQIPWTVSASSPSGIQVYTFLVDGARVDALFDSGRHETISLDTTNLING